MAAKLHLLLCFLFFFISVNQSLSLSHNFTFTTAHDELKTNGFPIGLLPTGVISYSLNRSTGDFEVEIVGGGCKLLLPPDNYLAKYSGRITGKLQDRRIAELDGIRVRAFFRWWSITGIKLSGDDLVFEVGSVSAKYPAKNFDEIPECDGRGRASS